MSRGFERERTMETKARQIEGLFDRTVRYQMPLFQRLLSIVFLANYGLKNVP